MRTESLYDIPVIWPFKFSFSMHFSDFFLSLLIVQNAQIFVNIFFINRSEKARFWGDVKIFFVDFHMTVVMFAQKLGRFFLNFDDCDLNEELTPLTIPSQNEALNLKWNVIKNYTPTNHVYCTRLLAVRRRLDEGGNLVHPILRRSIVPLRRHSRRFSLFEILSPKFY